MSAFALPPATWRKETSPRGWVTYRHPTAKGVFRSFSPSSHAALLKAATASRPVTVPAARPVKRPASRAAAPPPPDPVLRAFETAMPQPSTIAEAVREWWPESLAREWCRRGLIGR